MSIINTDETINFAMSVRDSIPKAPTSYVYNDSIKYKAMKEDLETINGTIENYMILHDLLADLAETIKYNITEYRKCREEVTKIVSGMNYNESEEIDTISVNNTIAKPLQIIDYITESPSVPMNVHISGGISLPAINVDDRNLVRGDGNLYYVKPINKFAFRLNGQLFSGNIGEIYTYDKNPKRIKVCTRGSKCDSQNKCAYYHPGTSDIRNFISGGFAYQRKTTKNNGDDTPGRKIGNRSTLREDIQKASVDDKQLFGDQCMHDILCNLAIHNN